MERIDERTYESAGAGLSEMVFQCADDCVGVDEPDFRCRLRLRRVPCVFQLLRASGWMELQVKRVVIHLGSHYALEMSRRVDRYP